MAHARRKERVEMLSSRRARLVIAITLGLMMLALAAAAAELTRMQAQYYDRASGGVRSGVNPQGETDLRLSGKKVSNWPPLVGTWIVTAKGTHRSWTSVSITAIGVEGELELTAGGETYDDFASDGWLNSDEAEARTECESDEIPGTALLDCEAEASSDHEFYDSRLGGWLFLFTSVSGGL
jgi:hypothetical protein